MGQAGLGWRARTRNDVQLQDGARRGGHVQLDGVRARHAARVGRPADEHRALLDGDVRGGGAVTRTKAALGSMEASGWWGLWAAGSGTHLKLVMTPEPGGLFRLMAPLM